MPIMLPSVWKRCNLQWGVMDPLGISIDENREHTVTGGYWTFDGSGKFLLSHHRPLQQPILIFARINYYCQNNQTCVAVVFAASIPRTMLLTNPT
jgi:hypothetical protein